MVIRNCLQLLSELTEIEECIKEAQKQLASAGVQIEQDELLKKFINEKMSNIKAS
jgi:L-lysine 2,3-aminomutase